MADNGRKIGPFLNPLFHLLHHRKIIIIKILCQLIWSKTWSEFCHVHICTQEALFAVFPGKERPFLRTLAAWDMAGFVTYVAGSGTIRGPNCLFTAIYV
jgi:hypothetical protein